MLFDVDSCIIRLGPYFQTAQTLASKMKIKTDDEEAEKDEEKTLSGGKKKMLKKKKKNKRRLREPTTDLIVSCTYDLLSPISFH